MQRRALGILLSAALLLIAGCGGGSGNNTANRNISQLHDPKTAATAAPPTSLSTPLPAANLPALAAGGASAAPGADVVIVAAGDTLSGIASKAGVSLSDLEAANPNIDPSNLKIGASIKIPQPGATPAPSSTPTPTPGAGGLTLATPGPQPTAVGGGAQIPPTGGAPSGSSTPPAGSAATAASTSAAASAGEYSVKQGDNACKIATENKITVAELAAANNLSVSQVTRLTVGQLLKIPPSTGHIGCT